MLVDSFWSALIQGVLLLLLRSSHTDDDGGVALCVVFLCFDDHRTSLIVADFRFVRVKVFVTYSM